LRQPEKITAIVIRGTKLKIVFATAIGDLQYVAGKERGRITA
jgi:hypothetical protein